MNNVLHIYTRVSSAAQEDGTSLETQKDLGIKKSKDLGMAYKIWNEGAASSHDENLANRPKINELLVDVENGNIKHLFVYNNDRLSRNDKTQFIIKNAITKHGVILYTKDGTYDLNNPTDKLFKQLLDALAEYENALRSERTRLGKLNKVRQGGWHGAPAPYGYEIINGKLSVHKNESVAVKNIFSWFNSGNSVAEIKSKLDKQGVTARRGGLFSTGSINKLMQNTHHKGFYTYTDKKSDETITVPCPALVDETIWDRVQERRHKIYSRKGQNNRTKRFYLLRNLMYCGECGSQISGRINESRNEQHYFCPKKTRNWKTSKPLDKQRYA
jgi:DNA invertase Pin-like site-specific DNA recombinase